MPSKKLKVTEKKALAKEVIAELRKIFPAPECALVHNDSWELLVATILSAQCTDKRVNMVTPGLFEKYPTMQSIADAEQEEFEQTIKSTGFFRNKAKNIIACANALIDSYDGEIPQKLEQLVKLPGVGRKTGSVVLGTCFGKAEGIVVDTHVKRLSYRIGLAEQKDPLKVETELLKVVPKKDWIDYSHLLILHGRQRCDARKPDCENCEIEALCLKRI